MIKNPNNDPNGSIRIPLDFADRAVVGTRANSNYTVAWLQMLLCAAVRPGDVWVKSQRVSLKKGQLVTSCRGLADSLKWSQKQARTFLNHLVSTGLVHVEDAPNPNLGTIVTIVDFDEYLLEEEAA